MNRINNKIATARIKDGLSFFCDRYKENKLALMQEGQTIEIVESLGNDSYKCSIVDPSKKCIDHGGYAGMKIVLYSDDINID